MSPTDPLRARFAALGDALRARFVERDALIDAALCALVCGQHLLIIGPPGTAKSLLATALCEALEGAAGFQWLLTRFTTPEELFGPISLKGLEEDRYVRLTAGKLPTAQIVFLDEVFKASSAILNALLTVLNERRFHNDARAEPVPLITLIGASNELPDEDDELQALYDRFLVRVMVDYVEADYRFVKLLTLGEPGPLPMVTLNELATARAAAAALPLDAQVLRDLPALRAELRKRGVVCSDRRWRQALGYLRAHAWLAGRARVGEADLAALEPVLWSDPESRDEVRAALDGLLTSELQAARQLVFQARELAAYPDEAADDEERAARLALEAYTKLGVVRARAVELVDAAARRGRNEAELQTMVAEIDRLRAAVQRHLKAPLQ